MIQRIQSVYLLIAAIVMIIALSSNLVYFKDASQSFFYLSALGFISNDGQQILYTWGILVIGIIITLLSAVAIFLFKDRNKQMKLTLTNALLVILLYITIAVYAYSGMGKFDLQFVSAGYALGLPIIVLILTAMAYYKIKKDEKLVRSLNRIR